MEQDGIPTVAVHTNIFARLCNATALSKRPFMQEVIEGLTVPLETADLQGVSYERTTPRLLDGVHA